jgi:hypothetical protein
MLRLHVSAGSSAPHNDTPPNGWCSSGTAWWMPLVSLVSVSPDDDIKESVCTSVILGVSRARTCQSGRQRSAVPFAELRRSWLFVLLSIWSAVIPASRLSLVSTDFSSLVGGGRHCCRRAPLQVQCVDYSATPLKLKHRSTLKARSGVKLVQAHITLVFGASNTR